MSVSQCLCFKLKISFEENSNIVVTINNLSFLESKDIRIAFYYNLMCASYFKLVTAKRSRGINNRP